MTYEQIIKDIKAKKYAPIYFLEGQETYFIDEVTKLIEKTVLDEAAKGFNELVLYGKDTDSQTIINTARRYPMMSPYQVVIVKEAQQLREKSGVTNLLSYFENPVKSTVLVINYKHKKLDKRTKFAKTFKKNGIVHLEAKKLYDNQVPAWIEKHLKSKKHGIEQNALYLLAEYLGTNISQIVNELDKMLLNLDKGAKITPELIEKYIGINREYNSFELQRALAYKQSEKAFRIITYFNQNPKAAPLPLLMYSLYNFFSKLYIYHYYAQRTDFELQKILSLSSSFFVKEYRAAAKNYTIGKVRKNLGLLLKYDLKSKGVDQADNTQGPLIVELTYQLLN